MTEIEQAARAELTRLNHTRRAIIEQEEQNFLEGSSPELWKFRDGTYVLSGIDQARAQMILTIALERNTKAHSR